MNKQSADLQSVSGRLLPDFLGIGAMRSGTTLLHRLLASHAQIYVPRMRKEIHFFDENYGKGLAWYGSFFPVEAHASRYRAIGEVTPRYIFKEQVPRLVKRDLPQARFILMLRNPVDRLYSHFRFALAKSGRSITFHDFICNDSAAVRRGFYAEQLARWLRLFPRERFLILVFEEFIGDPGEAVQKLGDFLGVEANGFDKRLFEQKAAASLTPRLPRLYRAGLRLRNFLRDRDLDRIYAILRFGRSLLTRPRRPKETRILTAKECRELYEIYAKDIQDLESMLGRDLDIWRPAGSGTNTLRDPAPTRSRVIL